MSRSNSFSCSCLVVVLLEGTSKESTPTRARPFSLVVNENPSSSLCCFFCCFFAPIPPPPPPLDANEILTSLPARTDLLFVLVTPLILTGEGGKSNACDNEAVLANPFFSNSNSESSFPTIPCLLFLSPTQGTALLLSLTAAFLSIG
jgi:hypothetical protein